METISYKTVSANSATVTKEWVVVDAEGQVFNGPEERQALFNTLKEKIDNPFVKILEMEHNINEDAFAVTAAKELIALMEKA